MNKEKKSKIRKKLLHKYQLLILNEETFEERFSIKLSRLNVFVIVGLSIIVFIILTTLLIGLTPLREYIPGQSSADLRKKAVHLVYKVDSLEQVVEHNKRYFATIQHILKGEPVPQDPLGQDTLKTKHIDPQQVNLAPSKADSLLREKVEQQSKYNVFYPALDKSNYMMFPPVKGQVTEAFDQEAQHYGVDISVPKNMPVKATADGTVIFAEWTAQTGYVIILEHNYGLISVYKHNASLTKEQGDRVKAGEVIAMTGNTGAYTTGPHLHFELWRNGYPIDPTQFLDFE